MAKVEMHVGPLGHKRWGWDCPGCGMYHEAQVMGPDGEPRWSFNGDVNSPTFSPSLLVTFQRTGFPQQTCHFFVRNGRIEFLSDCTHALKGQTVDMVEIPDAENTAHG